MLPPSRTIVLVEFFEASDARKAFRALAYRKFKMEPLYLEACVLCHVCVSHVGAVGSRRRVQQCSPRREC